jgi:hypothetical protein
MNQRDLGHIYARASPLTFTPLAPSPLAPNPSPLILRIAPHTSDWGLETGIQDVLFTILILTAVALVLLAVALRQRRWAERARTMRRLLDGADALETQLLECRARMQQLKGMLVALPEEMSADANSALTADDKVQAALRDLLAHRLWIKQHAASASRSELDTACSAIEQSYQVMQSQLARLDAITGELAAAQSSASQVAPRGKSG